MSHYSSSIGGDLKRYESHEQGEQNEENRAPRRKLDSFSVREVGGQFAEAPGATPYPPNIDVVDDHTAGQLAVAMGRSPSSLNNTPVRTEPHSPPQRRQNLYHWNFPSTHDANQQPVRRGQVHRTPRRGDHHQRRESELSPTRRPQSSSRHSVCSSTAESYVDTATTVEDEAQGQEQILNVELDTWSEVTPTAHDTPSHYSVESREADFPHEESLSPHRNPQAPFPWNSAFDPYDLRYATNVVDQYDEQHAPNTFE